MQIFSRIYACTYLLTLVSLLLLSCSGSNAGEQVDEGALKEGAVKEGAVKKGVVTNGAVEKDAVKASATNFSFNTDPGSVVKDFKTWWNYHYRNINLTEDFTAIDTDSSVIGKEKFLTELATGKYVPIRLALKDGVTSYQLYRLAHSDPGISTTMKDDADQILKNYRMEGTQLPDFHFVDLQGNQYDPGNTRGKTLVLKCWFIHCVACVEEFPELNKLVDEFKHRSDVLFVSLAMDDQPALQKFLETRSFKYAVVPGKKHFMVEDLRATQFPTHVIVDKDGKIRKVVNRCEEMVPALKRIIKET